MARSVPLARAFALAASVASAGCATTEPPPGGAGIYGGTGFYEAWVWGPVYREVPIVVGPPARPARRIAPAPAPSPAAPSRPAPG
jgi:hypothetical protein